MEPPSKPFFNSSLRREKGRSRREEREEREESDEDRDEAKKVMYVSGTFVGAVAAVMIWQLAVRTPKRSDRPEMWGSEGEVAVRNHQPNYVGAIGTHWYPYTVDKGCISHRAGHHFILLKQFLWSTSLS